MSAEEMDNTPTGYQNLPVQDVKAQQVVRAIIPDSMDEALAYAEKLAGWGMVPKSYKVTRQVDGKWTEFPEETVGRVAIGILTGMELGLTPLQSLKVLYVVNGLATVYGDGLMGLLHRSGQIEWVKEWFEDGKGNPINIAEAPDPDDLPADFVAICEMKRKGHETPYVGSFSRGQAKKAGLLGKKGPWQAYPYRMQCWRARSWAARLGFADILSGVQILDEVAEANNLDLKMTGAGEMTIEGEAVITDPLGDDLPEQEATKVTKTDLIENQSAGKKPAVKKKAAKSTKSDKPVTDKEIAAATGLIDEFEKVLTLEGVDNLLASATPLLDKIKVHDPQLWEEINIATLDAKDRIKAAEAEAEGGGEEAEDPSTETKPDDEADGETPDDDFLDDDDDGEPGVDDDQGEDEEDPAEGAVGDNNDAGDDAGSAEEPTKQEEEEADTQEPEPQEADEPAAESTGNELQDAINSVKAAIDACKTAEAVTTVIQKTCRAQVMAIVQKDASKWPEINKLANEKKASFEDA